MYFNYKIQFYLRAGKKTPRLKRPSVHHRFVTPKLYACNMNSTLDRFLIHLSHNRLATSYTFTCVATTTPTLVKTNERSRVEHAASHCDITNSKETSDARKILDSKNLNLSGF